jgi:anti-anti-sigma factor
MLHVQEVGMDADSMKNSRDTFEILARANENVTIDLTNVKYIDSSSIAALVYMFKRLRARGHSVRVINLNEQPMRLFSELRLTKVLCS